MACLPEGMSQLPVAMRKTTVEKPESVIPAQSRSLLRELDLLAEHYAKLADWLGKAADDLAELGLSPSESLVAALSDASRDFVSLRERVLEHGRSLSVFPPGKILALSSLKDLRVLLVEILTAEEPIVASGGKLTTPPFVAMPDPRQEAERTSEPGDSSFPELLATDMPAAAPSPPFPDDLPAEVEQFLERLIQEASRDKEAQEISSSGVTGNFARPEPVLPRQERPVPEASPIETEESPVRGTAPSEPSSAPETLVSEPRGREQGKYAYREGLCWNSSVLAKKMLEPDHPEVADLLGNLALLCHKRGKYADAETVHQRALLIREKCLGPEHPRVATSLNNLAALYREQGNYEEARKHWDRSLAIVEKAWGPEHPKTALRVSNLADLFYLQGEYDRSEQFFQRLLAILEKGCAGKRPDVMESLKNYLALLRKGHRKKEALQVETRVQALFG